MYHIELTPAAIWKDLSICDIYSASIKGLCALFLLDTGNMTQFSKYLLTEKSCTSLLNFEVTSKKKRDLQGIAFLMDVSQKFIAAVEFIISPLF
jgi:hypothetical protein